MQKSLVVIYLQGGNDGLNVTVPVDTVYTGYQAARATSRASSDPQRVARSAPGRWAAPAAASASPTSAVSAAGHGDNGDPALGFDSLYGDGSGGAGSDLAIFPAADYTPSNRGTSRARTSGSAARSRGR